MSTMVMHIDYASTAHATHKLPKESEGSIEPVILSDNSNTAPSVSDAPSPLLTASGSSRPRSSTLHSATSSQTPLRRATSAALRRLSREYSARGSEDLNYGTAHFGPDGKYIAPPPLAPLPVPRSSLDVEKSAGGRLDKSKRRRNGDASLKAAQRAWQQTPDVGEPVGMSTHQAANALLAASSSAHMHQPATNPAAAAGVQMNMVRGSGYARYPTTKSSAPKTLRVEGQRVKGFKSVWRNFVLGLRLKFYRFKKSLGLGGAATG